MQPKAPQTSANRLRFSSVALIATAVVSGAALLTGVATAQEGSAQGTGTQALAHNQPGPHEHPPIGASEAPSTESPSSELPEAPTSATGASSVPAVLPAQDPAVQEQAPLQSPEVVETAPGVVAAEVEAKDELSLSPEQMGTRGAAAVAAIDTAQTTVAGMVASAKDNRDVVKVLCLDDKNSQVGVALRTAQDREASLRAALAAGALERARHEFTLLMVLKERVDVLLSEANQCIGEETGFTGESELIVEVDPNLPEVEPETVIIAPATVIEPAEVSSPS